MMPLWLLIPAAVLAYIAAAALLGRRLKAQQPPASPDSKKDRHV